MAKQVVPITNQQYQFLLQFGSDIIEELAKMGIKINVDDYLASLEANMPSNVKLRIPRAQAAVVDRTLPDSQLTLSKWLASVMKTFITVPPKICEYTLIDTFTDLKYEDRSKPTDYPECTYPEWTLVSGSWDASAGYARSNIHESFLRAQCTQAYGSWQFKFKFDGVDPSPNPIGFEFYLIFIDTSNYYRVLITTHNIFGMLSNINGGASWLMRSSWSPDTNWHSVKITRNSGGRFELYLDDIYKGAVVDTNLTTSNFIQLGYTRWGGGSGSYVNVDNIMVKG